MANSFALCFSLALFLYFSTFGGLNFVGVGLYLREMYFYYAISITAAFVLFEILYTRTKGILAYTWGEAFVSISVLGMNYLFALFFRTHFYQAFLVNWEIHYWVSGPIRNFVEAWKVAPFQDYPILRIVILFLVVDFFYFLTHFLHHKINFLWAGHFVHHSFSDYNILNSHRDTLKPFQAKTFGFVLLTPFALISFDYKTMLLIYFFIQVYANWIHLSFVPKLGILEKVFVTPSNHRVHHRLSENEAHNFGGVLIIWDRIFGTYKEESGSNSVYGVKGFERNSNLFHSIFHQYIEMFKSFKKCKSIREGFSVLFWKI